MRQKNRTSRFGRVACAFILSILMAAGPMMEGAAWTQYAYAVDTASLSTVAPAQTPNAAEADGNEVGSEGAKDASGNASSSPDEEKSQFREEVALEEAPKASAGSETPPSPGSSASDQIAGEVELTENDAPAKIGSIVYDGLTYDVQPDGTTVALAGFDSVPPRGDVVVPAFVVSGSDRFAVTSVADGALEGCADVASVSLPASVERIAQTAFDGADSLASIQVNKKNEHFSSHDGMLFDKEGASLVRCPQGKAGAAVLPASVQDASPEAFDGCSKLVGVQVAAGSATYASIDGKLCSADLSQLVFCPAGVGDAVSVAPSVRVIGSKAFAGCAVTSVAALGNVLEIADDAFSREVRARAVVALPGGEGYEARKAVWETAGFSQFVEPANPGDVSVPESSGDGNDATEAHGSGLAYEVREDYTLAVSWQGAEGPEGDLEIPATVELGGVSYRVSAVASAGFAGSASLTSVVLPASVTVVGEAAFAGCSSLASAVLPDGLREVGERAFEATAVADAWLPASVVRVGERAFASCGSLARVVALGTPEVASDALAECAGVFVYCPSGAQAAWNVGLPAAGNHLMPYGVDVAADSLHVEAGASASIFDGGVLEAPAPVEVSYSYGAKPLSVDSDGMVAGKAEGASEVSVALSLEGAELARASRAVEVTAARNAVALALLDDSEPRADVWAQTFAADAILTGDDLPPAREGQIFTLWYTDEACTVRFDYSKPLADQASSSGDGYVLYGKYEAGTLEGPLPTVGNVGSASWSLSDAGTLYIRGGADAVIDDFGYVQEDGYVPSEGVWSPYRSMVKKASMALGLNAVNTVYWFAGMKSLTDISEVYIPVGVTVASRMFDQDSRLSILPETFVLPEGVEIAQSLFRGCPLEAIPEGFRLPGTILDANSMFANGKFVSIPETFELPASLTSVRWLFSNCTKLASLPESFALPVSDHRLSAGYLFNGCRSLASLPENFVIPPNTGNYECMFINCTSLTMLPRNFTLPTWSTGQLERLFFCDIESGQPRVTLYYEGDDPAVLNLDWESQNRTLITDDADMGDFGMKHVTFKVQSADEAAGFPWETRSTAWTNKQGVLANPGVLQLGGYTFSGWCVDEDCLELADFTKPFETDRTLYGKWIMHGGKGTQEGGLPTVGSDGMTKGFDAWWAITADGQLRIASENGSSIEGLRFWENGRNDLYWRAYRTEVKSILMVPGLQSSSDITKWFAGMTRLEDVSSGFFIPDNCVSVANLFNGCTSLKKLPLRMFEGKKSLANLEALFQSCTSLSELPVDFTLPESTKNASSMFFATAIEVLPEGFGLDRATNLNNLYQMFGRCPNLASLPESMVIPSSVTNVKWMFCSCPKLKSLPANLLSRLSDEAKGTVNANYGMFGFFESQGGAVVETYYPASPDQVDIVKWSQQGRRIVGQDSADRHYIAMLMLPSGGSYESWMVLRADDSNVLQSPTAPPRASETFVGWYGEPSCENEIEFPYTMPNDTVLYAKYQENSGELPTTGTANPYDASWELTADGTLEIHCAEGATIDDLQWTEDTCRTDYWGPLRSKVKRVEMAPGLKARTLDCWFMEMTQLETTSGIFVPDTATSVYALFNKCDSLRSVSDSFTIPEGVTSVRAMFRLCPNLKKVPRSLRIPTTAETVFSMFEKSGIVELPEGFVIPEGVRESNWMFAYCSDLSGLPEGFTLPKTTETCRDMFLDCSSLRSLPEKFTVPGFVTSCENMFGGCLSLTSLPAEFALSENTRTASGMFKNCPKLTYLPESIDIASLQATGADVSNMFSVAAQYASTPVTTLYLGAASNIPNSEWWLAQNRTIVTNPADLPEGSYRVVFKVRMPGDASSKEWATALATRGDDGVTRIADPAMPVKYGYAFSGWCTEEMCAEGSEFDFSQPVAGDLVLYGSYTLTLDVDVPLAAKVTVDASGEVAPARFDMVSNTPKKLLVVQVASQKANGASTLFPTAGDIAKVELDIKLGSKSTSLLVENGSDEYVASLPAASAAKPTVLDGSIGLSLNGAQIDYQPGDDITSLAKLTWTIEAA